MATTSIVRIGPTNNNLSAIVLRNALTSYFHDDDENNDHDRSNVDGSNDDGHETSNMVVIRNKYFSANILLADIEDHGSTTTSSSLMGSKDDGMILVFDALKSNPDRQFGTDSGGPTFDTLQLVHQHAETMDKCGDLLRLCVGVCIGDLTPEELRGTNHEQEYSRRILWCLDHGYEYVEADLSQEGQLRGHGVRDKDGFARVVEAIEGTMWSSAVMSQSKTNELKVGYQNDKSALTLSSTTQEVSSNTDHVEVEEEENPYQPPDPSMLIERMVQDDTISSAIDSRDVVGSLHTVGGETTEDRADFVQLRKDLESEKAFDEMEMMLREASRIREASKNGTMSDEERRERAGDAALRLINLMSHLGLDDDDEPDGYNSDESGNDVDAVDDSSLK
jgi:hypothetical protein